MARIVIAGGGTGGHLFPGIALAQELKTRDKNAEIIFVGTKKGIESKKLPQLGFDLVKISILGLSRKATFKNLLVPLCLVRGMIQSFVFLGKFNPDLVVGTGGYVSYPVLLLANLKGIPTLIQEQNSYPGITTRLLASRADKVCLTYGSSLKHFRQYKKNPDKFKVLGNPIRKGITYGDRALAQKKFNLKADQKTIFIFGGSQGAHRINMAVLEALDDINDDFQILWQPGEKDFDYVSEKVKSKKINISLFPFINEMGLAYAAADLVVSRSGALTLAEITACGKPAILIPYPFAAADHQRFNAQELEDKGAAKVILENQLDGKKLAGLINQLLSDEDALKRMSQASKTLAKPDAASKIADEIEQLLKK
jgi:UDP-N-acetylglucosamine--N-acetylmuramyl-(pentapeptide) pyrophosphoryl-undecaprenol N-acetylglucosamine transferase